MIAVYGRIEEEMEERKRFWNDLDRVVDRLGNRYRIYVLGDLNGWFGDRVKVGITVGFGVSGESDYGRRVIDIYVEKGLYVSNIYFEHKSSRKYTRVATGQDVV